MEFTLLSIDQWDSLPQVIRAGDIGAMVLTHLDGGSVLVLDEPTGEREPNVLVFSPSSLVAYSRLLALVNSMSAAAEEFRGLEQHVPFPIPEQIGSFLFAHGDQRPLSNPTAPIPERLRRRFDRNPRGRH